MNRKELLKKIDVARVGNGTQTYNDVVLTLTKEEILELIQYVDKLEKENKELKGALEDACERLEYSCPVEEELIEDLDCENCNDNYKECWKKFFLKRGRKEC